MVADSFKDEEDSMSAAVLCQAYESGGLTSGDGKLHSASMCVGDHVSPEYARGESVDP